MTKMDRVAGAAPAFLDLVERDRDADRAAAVIIPVPYDATSSWVKGADRGPAAIIEASRYVELYDIETRSEPWQRGIATDVPVEHDGGPEALAEKVAARVGPVLARGQVPVVLGGEHSVTVGAVRAARERYDDLTVLQIDAHGDTREEYEGSPYNHACVMARVRERCPIVQVGLRSVDTAEMESLDESRVFWAHDIVGRTDTAWMDDVRALLTDDVYVTIDLDAFDPSVIPATGTPEPGGMTWYEVTRLLERVAKRSRVRAFDVVELCPAPGHHASAFTAAKLVYRFLALALA